MKLTDQYLEVFVSSQSKDNPYIPREKECVINSGLYCEHVIKNKIKLLIPNALKDKKWKNNPDIKLGMIFYLGFPILLPNGEPFGTICILDRKERHPRNIEEKLILSFSELIESHIEILYDNHLLNIQKEELKALVEREIRLKEVIDNVSKYENHDDIYNYLTKKLTESFNANSTIHYHYSEEQDIYAANVYFKNKKLKTVATKLLSANTIKELKFTPEKSIIAISNIDKEIKNKELKAYFKNLNINSMLMYRSLKKTHSKDEILSLMLLGYQHPTNFSNEIIDEFKLLINTSELIFLEAKQRNELKETRETFLATLIHDLRSPILAEQKALEFMLAKSIKISSEDSKEYLEEIYKTNEELLRLINNILSIYHFESGEVKLNLEQCNLKNLILDSVKTLKYLAEDNESSLITNIQEDLPLINLDKTEIKRVIINLISNAIKHNEKGTQITVSASCANEIIQISINDNGKGIPKKDQKKVFQRYPFGKGKVGSGLGLYLSKQIIALHKGEICFKSEEGKGTTFNMSFKISNIG